MNSFFKTFFACLSAIAVSGIVLTLFGILFMVSIIMFFVGSGSDSVSSPQPHSILKIDLSKPIVDKANGNPLEMFDYNDFSMREELTLLDATTMINRATSDPAIDGIYLSIPAAIPSSLSTLYELRQAIDEFRSGGKFVIAYGDVYSQGGYYIATAADRIFMNPQGGMDWTGLSSSTLFYKGLFDKMGIQPELIRHGSYKGAGEPFIRESLSPENRLQIESMLGSMWDYMVGQISLRRDIPVDSLQSYASTLAVGSPRDAIRLGLVDSLCYRDQLSDHLVRWSTQDSIAEPRLVTLSQYKHSGRNSVGNAASNKVIAVLYADGEMMDVGDKNKQIVGNALAAELSKLRRDKQVKAVVLRVNSPGGSALAAEVIAREVELTALEKPVIVSMGGYAASGGYYISAPADLIISTPTTLTGSIGVFGLLFNVEKGAKEHLGLTTEVVQTNPSAGMGNIFRPLTTPERAFIQNGVDSVYNRFVAVVATGRNMSPMQVDSIAQGRVWTGIQAKQNGLVDRNGSLSDAIQAALDMAGIHESYDFRLESYPQQTQSSFEFVMNSLSGSIIRSIKGEVPLAAQTQMIQQMIENQGVKVMMPYQIEISK